jgi:hypothetical protein
MKLRLHWAEKYEMVREYPTFELDSERFPELELEITDIYRARTAIEQDHALNALEYKMQHTPGTERGETIFQIVGPCDSYKDSHVYPISDEVGSFQLTGED